MAMIRNKLAVNFVCIVNSSQRCSKGITRGLRAQTVGAYHTRRKMALHVYVSPNKVNVALHVRAT